MIFKAFQMQPLSRLAVHIAGSAETLAPYQSLWGCTVKYSVFVLHPTHIHVSGSASVNRGPRECQPSRMSYQTPSLAWPVSPEPSPLDSRADMKPACRVVAVAQIIRQWTANRSNHDLPLTQQRWRATSFPSQPPSISSARVSIISTAVFLY